MTSSLLWRKEECFFCIERNFKDVEPVLENSGNCLSDDILHFLFISVDFQEFFGSLESAFSKLKVCGNPLQCTRKDICLMSDNVTRVMRETLRLQFFRDS